MQERPGLPAATRIWGGLEQTPPQPQNEPACWRLGPQTERQKLLLF